jgi:hypothetical protein
MKKFCDDVMSEFTRPSPYLGVQTGNANAEAEKGSAMAAQDSSWQRKLYDKSYGDNRNSDASTITFGVADYVPVASSSTPAQLFVRNVGADEILIAFDTADDGFTLRVSDGIVINDFSGNLYAKPADVTQDNRLAVFCVVRNENI